MRTFSSSRAETSSCPVSSDAVSHSGHRFHLTEFGAARRPFDERGGKADLPHAANDALAGCGKSRDFGKTVMKRARNGNPGLIKSTGYEGAKGDESGWKHHRPTFSAAC